MDIGIESDTSSISVTWSDIGEIYVHKLIEKNHDKNIIYTGVANKYEIGDLEAGQSYKYQLIVYDIEGNVIEYQISILQQKSRRSRFPKERKVITTRREKGKVLHQRKYSIQCKRVESTLLSQRIK
ncbi:hypothetical protein [Mechercharimyces sp. CAU 1602]|uniref:hypothetical protein n=1 Tax=Mechercharimyces sp. CAU 1602 TaxID=2973933 RepID=UPI002163D75B|nr:hypothetical protein [Mechercharimyces sp. CAU 1602]MCS1351513.1 hypothetical protein [Mechercharimyces sp. CAU 1602]